MAHTANGVKILLGSVPTTHTLLSNSHHRARKSFVAADETAHSCRQRTRLAQRAPARPHVAFSVYRDEGALSEIDIVECLAEHDLLQLADLQTSLNERSSSTLAEATAHHEVQCPPTAVQPVDSVITTTRNVLQHGGAATPQTVLLTPAQRTARQRRLRNKYAAPDSSVRSPDWNATVQLNQLGSSILERRPKVQLAYQLQGCVTESAAPLQPKQHVNTVLSGDVQLELWRIFSAGRDAEKTVVALHKQLGRVPSGQEAATVLGFGTSDDFAKCLRCGQVAKSKLMATNMGLVHKLACQYSCPATPLRDLIQEGVWGLERGLEMYDPFRQAKVSTALYWYIRDAVRKAKLLQSTAIHIPLTTHEQIDKLNAVMRNWRRQYPDQEIPSAELSRLTNMGPPTLKRVLQASLLSERSLDLPVTRGHDTGFGSNAKDNWIDKIADDDLDEQFFYLQNDLKSAVASLPDPMSVIVQEKYGLRDGHAKNFKEVADLLDIKKWKVQQYYKTAMQTLQAQSQLLELAHAI